jgi:hypothetical protein
MATSSYLTARQKFGRPQGILWSKNPGVLEGDVVVPQGIEGEDFIILSDHNRTELTFNKNRIENRRRTINGFMRSYHIADKANISFSWNMLPSRSYSLEPQYNQSGKNINPNAVEYTADNGAGGVDVVKWYEDNKGPFYIFLAYDRYDKFESDPYLHLTQYNEVLYVYFASFDYSVIKRGNTTHDFWNIDVSLEEV